MSAINLRVSDSRKLRTLKDGRKRSLVEKAKKLAEIRAWEEASEAYRIHLWDHTAHVRMYCAFTDPGLFGTHFGGLSRASRESGEHWRVFIHQEERRQREYRDQAEAVKALQAKERLHAKHFVVVDNPEVTPSVPLTAAIVTLVSLFAAYLIFNI